MKKTRVILQCSELGDEIHVSELDGREEISQLFDLQITAVVPRTLAALPEDVIGSRGKLSFEVSEDGGAWSSVRHIHGIFAECEDVSSHAAHTTYRLRLVPYLWLAKLVETLDLFLDMSVVDIIRAKLELLDMHEGQHYEIRLDASKYAVRDLITQYKETDLEFLSRICEHYGIFFFFEHREEDVVVFADANVAFPRMTAPIAYTERPEDFGVYELNARARLVPKVFVQRDYNYRNPGVDLTAVEPNPTGYAGGIVEYGGHFKTEEEGQTMARLRAEERTCDRKVLRGVASIPSLGAGSTPVISGHPRGDMDLLLTRVTHRARQSMLMAAEGGEDSYVARFAAIEHSLPYRAPRRMPKPQVSGMVTGIVDGPTVGEYAHVDDQGRYHVRFMFDTSGRGEGKASRPVRMMQPHSGAGYGMHFPLRVGTEVLITFLDGDPDRPIIAGTVPNPQTPSPVSAENARKNILRTGGGNEIDIDDTNDEQRVKISTPYGGSVLQLGSPNAQESGTFLGTLNNATTSAGGTANTLTTFQSNWNTFNDTWSCHVTGFAGPTHPLAQLQFGIDSFRGIATTVSGICGGVLAIQDGIIGAKKDRLEKAKEEQKAAVGEVDKLAGPLKKKRRKALACITEMKDDTSLSAASLAKLADVEEKNEAYEEARAKLAADLAERDDKVAAQAAAKEEGKDTTAESFDRPIKRLNKEISKDRDELAKKKRQLNRALKAVADDEDLSAKTCGDDSCDDAIEAFATAHKAHAKAEKKMHDEREDVEGTELEIATTEANQKDTREDLEEVKKHADAFDAGISGFTGPLFSLVTALWGTGMQGYARNVSDFLLTDTVGQGMAFGNRVIPTGFGWQLMPPFMMTKPPDLTQPHTNPHYGRIAREMWYVDLLKDTKMLPGGGAGMLGIGMGKMGLLALIPLVGPLLAYKYAKGAFTEARNIQGSDDHAVLFGLKSVFVNGVEHATLSAGKNLVVTGDKRVEVHSRGKTEIAGGEVLVSAADGIDVECRGDVAITATGPLDGVTPQGSPSRFSVPSTLDKKRSEIAMSRGKMELTSFDAQGTMKLAGITLTGDDVTPIGKIELKTEGNNGFKLVQDLVPLNSQIVANTPGTFNVAAGQGIELTCSQSSLKIDQQGITLKVGAQAEINVKMNEVVMKMGPQVLCRLASDKAVLAWGPTQVVLRASALELKGNMQKHS